MCRYTLRGPHLESRLHFLLRVLQRPLGRVLLRLDLVGLRSGEALGLCCGVVPVIR